MKTRKLAWPAIAILAIPLTCAPPPKVKPKLPRLYEKRKEEIKGMDLTALRGRKIVIDPGHGGAFRGTKGQEGLDEADVNLGVALYLWGLLEEAGAHVRLTRKTDRDFVGGDSTRLRDDLAARVAVANHFQPDVFISLHHNADISRNPTRNEIQIFYKMTDPGPSRDIAHLIARHLRINVGGQSTKVLPGNYYVLRNCQSPAVLCEPSFLTNPFVESKLKLADKQRLEAEVYFIALLDYFSRGTPQILSFEPTGQVEDITQIAVNFESPSPLDPSSIRIALDGTDLSEVAILDQSIVAHPSAYLANGIHKVRVSARSISGNSTPVVTWYFKLKRPPAGLKIDKSPKIARSDFPQCLTAVVTDAQGMPVADSTRVRFIWKASSYETLTLRGRAYAYTLRDIPAGVESLEIACGSLTTHVKIPETKDSRWISGFVLAPDSRPLGRVIIVDPLGRQTAISDPNGFFTIEASHIRFLEIRAPGFRSKPQVKMKPYPVLLAQPFYKNISHRPRIAIDAQGSNDDPGWISKDGTTAAEINLQVAYHLQSLLRQAGFDAYLTRNDEFDVTLTQRVRLSERVGAELFLSIDHVPSEYPSLLIEHYPGSSKGEDLAHIIKSEFKEANRTSIGQTAEYVIQQTSCPAVKIVFGLRDDLGEHHLEAYPIHLRSYRLFCAILKYSGVKDTFSVKGSVYSEGKTLPNALVWIDGTLSVISDDGGWFELRLLERGKHTAVACKDGRCSKPYEFDDQSEDIRIELD